MAGDWDGGSHSYINWRRSMLDFVSGLADDTAVFSHFVAINALVGMIEADPRVVLFRPGHCSLTQLKRENGKLAVAEYGSESATRVL
jgi:broad specificity phosphatase PhoE